MKITTTMYSADLDCLLLIKTKDQGGEAVCIFKICCVYTVIYHLYTQCA